MKPRRYQPTPQKPIVAWLPQLPGGRVGMPVALNPIGALSALGACPDAFTLAERDWYAGLAGLGRFNAELATAAVARPQQVRDNLGELGAVPLLPLLAFMGATAGTSVVSKLVDRAFDAMFGDMDLELGGDCFNRHAKPVSMVDRAALSSSALAGYDADLSAGLRQSALAGIGELGGVWAALKRLAAQGAKALRSAGSRTAEAVKEGQGLAVALGAELKNAGKSGVQILDTMRHLLKLRGKVKKGGLKINPREGIDIVHKLVTSINTALGELTGTPPGEKRIVAELAGAGLALSRLDQMHRTRGLRRRLGWRPTLGEYALGCCQCMAADPAMKALSKLLRLDVFSPDTSKRAADLQAQHALQIADHSRLSPAQVGELGNVADFFASLAQGADRILRDLSQAPVGAVVIDGARQVIGNLIGQTSQAQTALSQVKSSDDYLARLREEQQTIEQQRASATDIARRAGYDEGLRRIEEEKAKARAERDEWKRQYDELRASVEQSRAQLAPAAQIVKDAKAKALEAEGQRVGQVNELAERDLLRGRVMVLSTQEYSDLVRQSHEARAAAEKLRMQAEQADRDVQVASKKLADYGVQIVELRRELNDLRKDRDETMRDAEIRARVEAERLELEDRLRAVTQRFGDELQRIRAATDEAVTRAGDVTSQTGVRMMFDFLTQLVGAMQQVRDVSQTGEFLRLFPQVLEQLRIAQQIASPRDPVVNVQVPPQAAPVVNVPAQEAPTFIVSPTLDIRPASRSTTLPSSTVPPLSNVQFTPGPAQPVPA